MFEPRARRLRIPTHAPLSQDPGGPRRPRPRARRRGLRRRRRGGGRLHAAAPTEEAAAGSLAIAAPADGALRYEPKALEAEAGKVTIAFDNPSQVPHAVEVEGNGVEEETETVTAGKATLALDLKAGEYELYCPVGNHKEAGMTGTLTVR